MNVEDAAAIFVGVLSTYISRGTTKTPPPMPRNPPIRPMQTPMAKPPMNFFNAPMVISSACLGGFINMRHPASARTTAMVIIKGVVSTRELK